MIKLFTLNKLSAFSTDAVYKICLALEPYGLEDGVAEEFEDYAQLLEAAKQGLTRGDDIIVAVQGSDFNFAKQSVMSFFSFEQHSDNGIAAAIAASSDESASGFDMRAFCSVPKESICHLSADGLYSGFTKGVSNGRLIMLPLDFGRLDAILASLVSSVYDIKSEPEQPEPELIDSEIEDGEEREEKSELIEPVGKMVYSLNELSKRIAIATGEAAMWIYDLYSAVDGLTEAVSFVEIGEQEMFELESGVGAEEQTQPEKEPERDEDDPEALFSLDGEPEQPAQQDENAENAENADSESGEQGKNKPEGLGAAAMKRARLAMEHASADFGAFISEIHTEQDEQDETNYFAYVAVSDGKTAGVKKIGTKNEQDVPLLLPHCVTVLCDTVCQKTDEIKAALENEAPSDGKGEEKKLSKGMIAFAAVIALIAVISPILILSSFVRGTQNPTADVGANTSQQIVTEQTAATDSLTQGAVTTEGNIFQASSATTTQAQTDAIFAPAEPTAQDVSVITTTPAVSSTSGTFTFYVFGYGHGVGMSQRGANDLAAQGWSFAEILANYYYGATLVSGDEYPEKITYNSTEYDTRDFLACAANGEVGDSFNSEAIKAQVVAIYTFAKYYGFKLDSSGTAYKSGASEKIYNIVDDVMKNGFYISFGGQTALTPFHAISAGKTTSYRNTWGNTDVSYLAGGRPSYGDYNAENFKTVVSMSSAEFKTLAESAGLGISCSGDPATWISIISHDTAVNESIGYVSSINVGGKVMTGNEFRNKVMNSRIRSHCFTVVYTPSAS